MTETEAQFAFFRFFLLNFQWRFDHKFLVFYKLFCLDFETQSKNGMRQNHFTRKIDIYLYYITDP